MLKALAQGLGFAAAALAIVAAMVLVPQEATHDLAALSFANPEVPRGWRCQRGGDRNEHNCEGERVLRHIHNTEYQILFDLQSPHGPIVRTMQIDANRGPPIEIEYADPRSLIWVMLHLSPMFAELMATFMPEGTGRTLMYMDDVRPGNIQRPDKGRLYYSWYMVLMELPAWWLNSDLGWLDIAVVQAKVVDGIRNGLVAFAEKLFDLINWPMTIEIPAGRPRPRRAPGASTYKLTFDVLLADAKAIMQITGVGGHSSYHPCCCCDAILGRLTEEDFARAQQTYYQPVTCLDEWKWGALTYEQFSVNAQHVKDAWLQSQRAGEAAETEYSIKFHSGAGIIYSSKAHVYRVPECVCWDAMHSIYASGGLAQFQCNDFICAVEAIGVPIASLQSFCEEVALPSGLRIRAQLAERVRKEAPFHLKAFASEMLDIIVCLNAFCDMVLVPEGMLPAETACMGYLWNVTLLLLNMGDRAHVFQELIDRRVSEWLQALRDLCPRTYKPKFHYTKHINKALRKWGKIMTCFGAERHHRITKQIAAWCYKHADMSMLRRALLRIVYRVRKPLLFTPNRLERRWSSRMRVPRWVQALLASAGMQFVAQGSRAHTAEHGVFGTKAFVLFATGVEQLDGGIPWAVGVITGLYETLHGCNQHVVAVITVHEVAGADAGARTSKLFRRTRRRIVVNLLSLRCRLATASEGECVRAFFPTDFYVILK